MSGPRRRPGRRRPRARSGPRGAKLARLGRLAARGWRVPDGYVVTVPALATWLPAAARERLAAVVLAADAAPTRRRGEARALIEAEPLGAGWRRRSATPTAASRSAAAAAPRLRVAVRSSAASEDAADGELRRPVRHLPRRPRRRRGARPRAPLLGEPLHARASLEYRRRHGLPPTADDLAVGVLELVDARSSGVLFTVDPVSGDRGRMVVEASWGLGECVVVGPCHAGPLGRGPRAAPSASAASRTRRRGRCSTRRAAGGVVERPMPPDLAGEPVPGRRRGGGAVRPGRGDRGRGGRRRRTSSGRSTGPGEASSSSSTAP